MPGQKRKKPTQSGGGGTRIFESVRHNFGRRADVFNPVRELFRTAARPRGRGPANASTDSLLRSARPMHGKATNESGSGMVTRTRIPAGPIKVAKTAFAETQPLSYDSNAGMQATCAVGVQNVFQVVTGTSTDYANIFTGNPIISATANKVLVESITFQCTIVNQSASAAMVTLWDTVPKRDCTTTATDGPAQSWITGIGDEAGGGATYYKTVGSKPWESDLFGQYWQIIKRHDVVLGPGEHVQHLVTWDVNKVLHQEVVTNSLYNIEHLTYGLLVAWFGAPAHDSTTKTQVSSAACNLDVVYSSSIRVKQLANASTAYARANTLASAFTVGQESFNPEVGQLQNSSGLNADILSA